MDRTWYTRVVVIALVALGSIWFLTPSYYSFFVLDRKDRNDLKKLEEALPAWAPPARNRLSLGLDLQGGIHMVMTVDTKTALRNRAERRGLAMGAWVKTKKLGEVKLTTAPENLEVSVTAVDPNTTDAIEKELDSTFEDFRKVGRQESTITYRLRDNQVQYYMTEAVDQAMLVIRKRIDKWGVAEVDVRKLGSEAIQISLPGQSDPERARELIGTTAQLEFRIVEDREHELFKTLYEKTPPEAASGIRLVSSADAATSVQPPTPYLESTDREALLAYIKDKAPEGRQIFIHCVEAEVGKKCVNYTTYLVSKMGVTGESLTSAAARQNQQDGQIEVGFEFDSTGAKELEELTGKNINRRMAVVLDENVVMDATIQDKIGASGRITLGQRSDPEKKLAEAHMLALALKAGALPAPVSPGEIRQVGASLGDELIRKGTLAAVVGLALVVLFMAIYYRVSGLVADVALILNGALILAGLALFGATLTLPGIAGFVLTLGIAVDANVLINERVREELRAGKSARAAVDQGYDRAFWTIFDAHVTTFIAGFILMITGTGPVRGFATALIIGIVASLFTSIVVTRVIVTWLVHGRNAQTVSV